MKGAPSATKQVDVGDLVIALLFVSIYANTAFVRRGSEIATRALVFVVPLALANRRTRAGGSKNENHVTDRHRFANITILAAGSRRMTEFRVNRATETSVGICLGFVFSKGKISIMR